MVRLTEKDCGGAENGMKGETRSAYTTLFVNLFEKRQPWRAIRTSRNEADFRKTTGFVFSETLKQI
jgi:hypothetical protein